MKNLILLSILLTLTFCNRAQALIVKDPSHIAISLSIAKRDLIEQIRREGNQRTQILRLVEQIRQIETFLDRLGDPEHVDLQSLELMIEFLAQLDLSKTSADIINGLDTDEIHRGPKETAVEKDILVDGEKVAEIDSAAFRPELMMRRSIDHYREVRTGVLERRGILSKELEVTTRQLSTASTQSEVLKLSSLIRSLEAQLAANDREMQFAANEVMTRYLDHEVGKAVRAKERVQRERAKLKHGGERDLDLYLLPSRPLLFKK